MIKILTILLAQPSDLCLLIKMIIFSFSIRTLNILVKSAIKSTYLLSDLPSLKHAEEDIGSATSLEAIRTWFLSIRICAQTKANTTNKPCTKIRRPSCSTSPKFDKIPQNPGVQCATM
ncbi:hypothetical protein AA0113_g10795 [Alternaria arborescens]|uniref:Uncharacterized protein n=1 Tax=Alternaria arborescens TaxID=156630 RepID=A0A4Q4QJU5_9PLEO|nr:hypothetical protein AA0112_g801 [Alternaria arborescens]RYO43551.1 hypothetical protein AA0113_g10795 [Alternaria arborescens]